MKSCYIIAEFQVKITIKSKVIKEKLKFCEVGHNQKFCQKNWHIFGHNFRTTQTNFKIFTPIDRSDNCASFGT